MAKEGKKVKIFSALEVANICGVVNQTAINWIKSEHLKAFTTPGGQYRIYAEDLYSFLENRGMRVPEELGELVNHQSTVLIIDDDKEVNNFLKDLFTRRLDGFSVFQAFDGFEAGRLLSEVKPTLVILDIDLPGVDGHTLCKRIKEDSKTAPTVISISGLDKDTEGKRILEEGADAFFQKPVDPEEIIDKVKAFTG